MCMLTIRANSLWQHLKSRVIASPERIRSDWNIGKVGLLTVLKSNMPLMQYICRYIDAVYRNWLTNKHKMSHVPHEFRIHHHVSELMSLFGVRNNCLISLLCCKVFKLNYYNSMPRCEPLS